MPESQVPGHAAGPAHLEDPAVRGTEPLPMRILSLDCGERHATLLWADADGRILESEEVPALPAEHLDAALLETLRCFLERIPPEPAGALLALPEPEDQARWSVTPGRWHGLFPHLELPWLCGSREAGLAGALRGRPGIVVHAGMRAVATSVDHMGRVVEARQAPDLLGDEGSALWLSSRALRLAVLGVEGRAQRCERLERNLTAWFGLDSLEQLMVDEGPTAIANRGELAEFVSVVLHLASYPDPDPGCRALVLSGSRRLVQLVQALSEKCEPSGTTSGSWSGQALYGAMLEAFRQEADRLVPGVPWHEPLGAAAEGVLLLGRAAMSAPPMRCGEQPDPSGALATGARVVGPSVWRTLFEHSRQTRACE